MKGKITLVFFSISTKARSYTCKFSFQIWKDLLACYNWLGAMALSGSSNRRHHYWSSSCWILQVYLFKLCCPPRMCKLCLVKNWDNAEGGALQCQQMRCCRGGGAPQEMSKNEMMQKGGCCSTTSKNETTLQRGLQRRVVAAWLKKMSCHRGGAPQSNVRNEMLQRRREVWRIAVQGQKWEVDIEQQDVLLCWQCKGFAHCDCRI